MTTLQLLRQATEEARAAVSESLPMRHSWNRGLLVGMCAVVAHETHRRLTLAGRRPSIEYRRSVCPLVDHFWVSCDGYVIDGTAKQLDGPLLYLSRNRAPEFFRYEAARAYRSARGFERFLRKLGWSGPSAALLVESEAA